MKVKTKKKLRIISAWQKLLAKDPDFWKRHKVNPDNPGPKIK